MPRPSEQKLKLNVLCKESVGESEAISELEPSPCRCLAVAQSYSVACLVQRGDSSIDDALEEVK